MCTITVVPLIDDCGRPGGLRLACNRDEKRSRPAALPPVVRRFGQRTALLPIDPVSDGTWIGVNNAGLAATLLNVNLGVAERFEGEVTSSPRASRGAIVPRVLSASKVTEVMETVRSLDPCSFPPFRLVLVDDRSVAQVRSDGVAATVESCELSNSPLLFTSSGLGDELVEKPRRELFEEMFGDPSDALARQMSFHRHRWPDRPHLSVSMSRPDARTVSFTMIDLRPDCVTLSYLPHSPDIAGNPIEHSLPRWMPGL